MSTTRKRLIAALLAALTAGFTVAVTTDSGPGHHSITVHVGPTIKVDGSDPDVKPDDPVVVTPPAAAVARTLAAGAANGTNDLQPREAPSLPPLAGKVTGPIATPLPPFASDSVPGCRTRTLPANWSDRAPGTRIEAFAFHYTAGPDVPNSRSDVDGLTVFGSHPSAAVSWSLNVDKDGNCDYNVPYRYKSWTIAGLNSVTANMEVAGTGSAPYLRPGGYRELARIWIDFHRRYPYIPLRLGATDGHCHITRTGIITHWMGGPCSGGHVDIKPLDLVAVIRTLRRYVTAAECNARCHLVKAVRAKHQRTHQRLVKNHCRRGQGGYCATLRNRNHRLHVLAKRDRIDLTGTFR